MNVTASSIITDTGSPMKMGCKPKGCPAICQRTAIISPLHMEARPAAVVTFFQNMPKITGANKPETVIAVPVTIRLTSPGMVSASTSAITDIINTDNLLHNSIILSPWCEKFGLMISLTSEDDHDRNQGMVHAITSLITDIINTDNLLHNSIIVSPWCEKFGLMISLTSEDDPARRKESALDMTAASSTTIIKTTSGKGNTSPTPP